MLRDAFQNQLKICTPIPKQRLVDLGCQFVLIISGRVNSSGRVIETETFLSFFGLV